MQGILPPADDNRSGTRDRGVERWLTGPLMVMMPRGLSRTQGLAISRPARKLHDFLPLVNAYPCRSRGTRRIPQPTVG